MPRRAVVLLLAVLLGCAGCQFPRDTEGTLDRVRDGGTLRVGVSEAEPFVVLDEAEPAGVEVRLLRDFARRQGARIAFTRGGEEELVERLREGELDVVASGATKRSPFKKEVAPTKPFATTRERIGGKSVEDQHVLFVRLGENALLVELERYLLDRKEPIRRLLDREGQD